MTKIKVCAPRKNPHICYVDTEYKDKIIAIKKKLKKTFFSILCICAGVSLDTEEQIREFKKKVKLLGYRTIGEWAEDLIDMIYENIDTITEEDLASFQPEEEHHEINSNRL